MTTDTDATLPVLETTPPATSPTYPRDPETQKQFEDAVAMLWETDCWTDENGVKCLNADLVLEGGGVKGIGLAGAILVLAEAGYHFPRVAGTSAGAIAAVLVASIEKAGKNMTELKAYLGTIDFPKFMHQSQVRRFENGLGLGKFAEAAKLVTHMGLYSGDYLAEWLGPILDGLGVATFGDLAVTTDEDPGMSLIEDRQFRLVVHASDISRSQLVHLPWDYGFYGRVPAGEAVIAAIRASMSIPFFFEPVRTTAHEVTVDIPGPGGGTVKQHYPGGTVTWVDGGMLANFPIDAFDRADGGRPRWPTIGIKLSAQPQEMAADVAADSTIAEAILCLHTMINEWDRYHVDNTASARTIFVDNSGISATEFHLTPEQQNQLFLNGAQAATKFLIDKAYSGGVPKSAPMP